MQSNGGGVGVRSSNNTSRCLMETMCRSSGKCPRAPCARGLMSWCGTISGAARRTTGSRAFACFLTPPRFSRIPQRSSHAPRREKLFKEAFCNTFVQRQTLAFNVFDFPLKLKNPRSLRSLAQRLRLSLACRRTGGSAGHPLWWRLPQK